MRTPQPSLTLGQKRRYSEKWDIHPAAGLRWKLVINFSLFPYQSGGHAVAESVQSTKGTAPLMRG